MTGDRIVCPLNKREPRFPPGHSPWPVLGTRSGPCLPEQGRPSVCMSESESLLSQGQQGDLACGSRAAKNSLETRAACCPPTPCVCGVGGRRARPVSPHGEASCRWHPWGTAEPGQLFGRRGARGRGQFPSSKVPSQHTAAVPGVHLEPGKVFESWLGHLLVGDLQHLSSGLCFPGEDPVVPHLHRPALLRAHSCLGFP